MTGTTRTIGQVYEGVMSVLGGKAEALAESRAQAQTELHLAESQRDTFALQLGEVDKALGIERGVERTPEVAREVEEAGYER